ncbi:MAG: metallophosphoesterase [Aquificaceae bacterium]
MRWFIPVFLMVFLFMHLYVYLRFFHIVLKSKGVKTLWAFVIFLGFISPFLWRYADHNWSPKLTYYIAFIGLLWMGFLLYLLLTILIVDVYKAFVFLSKKLFHINPLPTPSNKSLVFLVLVPSFSLSAYSYYETLNLKVERISIYTEKVPQNIKILHISDLHLGPVMGMDKIKLVLEVYKREKPHMVISTGDLVDGNMKDKDHLAQALAQINPPLGKYAVLGNHEYYRGIRQALDFTQRAGFKLLRGQTVYIKEYNLSLVGIEDDDCRFFKACVGSLSDKDVLQGANKESFVIYLKHKPRLEKGTEEFFDLMLSGHTHGGVYYPVGRFILTRLFISDRGLHKINNSYIYISKGVGTGGPPMRLFSQPDVAVIEILNPAQNLHRPAQ